MNASRLEYQVEALQKLAMETTMIQDQKSRHLRRTPAPGQDLHDAVVSFSCHRHDGCHCIRLAEKSLKPPASLPKSPKRH